MSASLFCGVLLDTQSDFQIVIERICDGVNTSILAGVSLTLLVGDDGCVIYDMVYTNIHGQFVVAVFSGTIFENIRTINDRAVGIHTTLMRGVLFADMQNYNVPKLHITGGKKTLYMASHCQKDSIAGDSLVLCRRSLSVQFSCFSKSVFCIAENLVVVIRIS